MNILRHAIPFALLVAALGAAPAGAQLPRAIQAVDATDSPPPGTPEYRLAPGDVVKVSVRNDPATSVERELSREGKITFPRAGEVTLGGLTRVGAEQAVSERLNSRKSGGSPKTEVEVSVTRYRSQ